MTQRINSPQNSGFRPQMAAYAAETGQSFERERHRAPTCWVVGVILQLRLLAQLSIT